jgi:nitric oxide dioxygenase
MLSASARPYIDASVPVLREHGLGITRYFYAQMFAAHPELKNVFNMGNQANGTQQGALAAAVFAYAANIDNQAALAVVAERIAHKHAAVGIKPEHYPVVARHLLGAIKHVLGEAATPELLAAWDEAYWLLAGDLIAAEARLYERSGRNPGELLELRVSEVRRETENVLSYYLQTSAGVSPGRFIPGQYVSVAVDLPREGLRQLRQYSLSDAPQRAHWRITVKQEPAVPGAPAGCVASHLHAHVQRGDALLVSTPFGNFTPPASGDRPLALLSAGVGITPMVSVLRAMPAGYKRPVLFAHAARDVAHHALSREVSEAASHLPGVNSMTWYESTAGAEPTSARAGRMALSAEIIAPYRDADFYLCGPLGFMREQWRALVSLGISPTQLHREVFGPESLDHLL